MPGEYHGSFQQMQEEAARRAREMRSRARLPQNRSGQRESSESVREREPPDEPSDGKDEPEEAEEREDPPREEKEDLLKVLFKDKDRTIILSLLLLLSGEEGHNELLFALLYLLM